jgi:hypothetical protein
MTWVLFFIKNYIKRNKNDRKAFSLHFHVIHTFFGIFFDRKIKIVILLPFQLLERGAKRNLGASAHWKAARAS